MNKDKFLSKLYDILIDSDIISFDDNPDLKTKKERLNNYLDKLDKVQNKALSKDDNITRLKKLYYDRYIIKRENIPDSYFESLSKQYLNEGHGHHNLVNPTSDEDKKTKEEHINTIIKEQKDSLDTWLDYFLSKDSDYLPMWAKVWAFQGMLSIGNLNKDKDGYGRRSESNVNPFVSLDSELLGKCVEYIQEVFNKKDITDDEIKKLVSSGSFPKLYGTLLANKKAIRVVSNNGIWVKYNYETEEKAERKLKEGIEPEYLKLYNDLQGYNTGWCTAGSRETAKSQICGGTSYQGGDFYVYYTKDENGEYKIPRIAIRMNKNSIGEIRGIAQSQNIESNMEKVLEEKLKEFPDASLYKKKVSDMKRLTEIYNTYKNRDLTIEELRFLYEIDENIKCFGYKVDPRIKEILGERSIKEDLAKIFNFKEDEVGTIEEDLKRDLVCYVGDIDYSHLNHIGNNKLPSKYLNGNLALSSLTTAEGLVLPQRIGGSLFLDGLTTAKGLILPQNIESLYLNGLTTAEDLVLPKNLRYLRLNRLSNAKGLTLPQNIESLYLNGLTTAEDLVLPKKLRYLGLNRLSSAKGLILPQNIESLYLNGLTTAEDLVLPQNLRDLRLNRLSIVKGLTLPENIDDLSLDGITIAEGLVLPQNMNGSLSLDSLITAKGLILPRSIGGILTLKNITTAEGLVLPQSIGVMLFLNELTSLKGITLPKECPQIYYKSNYFSLEEIKELQKQEELEEINKTKKSRGFISSIFIIISMIFIFVVSIIIGIFIINR